MKKEDQNTKEEENIWYSQKKIVDQFIVQPIHEHIPLTKLIYFYLTKPNQEVEEEENVILLLWRSSGL